MPCRLSHFSKSDTHLRTIHRVPTRFKEAFMRQRKWGFTAVMATIGFFCLAALASAEPYELSKNDLTDPKAITSQEISLFGVKLGDA